MLNRLSNIPSTWLSLTRGQWHNFCYSYLLTALFRLMQTHQRRLILMELWQWKCVLYTKIHGAILKSSKKYCIQVKLCRCDRCWNKMTLQLAAECWTRHATLAVDYCKRSNSKTRVLINLKVWLSNTVTQLHAEVKRSTREIMIDQSSLALSLGKQITIRSIAMH